MKLKSSHTVELDSLVNPGGGVVLPSAELLWLEPETDLVVGRLDGIGSVDDVTADIDAVITTDGAWCGVEGLGGTEHLSSGEDSVVAFPDHGADGTSAHVVDEATEERLGGEVSVVLLHVGAAWRAELHGDELESLLLESLHNGANESSLDTVGLDHDVGSLSFHNLLVYGTLFFRVSICAWNSATRGVFFPSNYGVYILSFLDSRFGLLCGFLFFYWRLLRGCLLLLWGAFSFFVAIFGESLDNRTIFIMLSIRTRNTTPSNAYPFMSHNHVFVFIFLLSWLLCGCLFLICVLHFNF